VYFLDIKLDSCWTHVDRVLGTDAWFVVPGMGILGHVGLKLDSCWTLVGLALHWV
jgi:hypothetical protein